MRIIPAMTSEGSLLQGRMENSGQADVWIEDSK
jgi:hypothetical protein